MKVDEAIEILRQEGFDNACDPGDCTRCDAFRIVVTHIADLSLRIAVAVKCIEDVMPQLSRHNDIIGMTPYKSLTMPIESLHEFIKNNPQYGEK